MNIKKKLENNSYTPEDLVEALNGKNPIIFYNAICIIAKNQIKDKIVIEKLNEVSVRLDKEDGVLGYYKKGHVSMSALLKLGFTEKEIFDNKRIDEFDKEAVRRFYGENDWELKV